MSTNKPEEDEFEPVVEVQFIRIGSDDLSGEELKSLMDNGLLPQEYINERNLRTLLSYECERMQESELCDVSVIIYCVDLIIRLYSDENQLEWWAEEFAKLKRLVQSIDVANKRVLVAFFVGELVSRYPHKANDREFVQEHIDKFVEYYGMENYRLAAKAAESVKYEDIESMVAERRESIKNYRPPALLIGWRKVAFISVAITVIISTISIMAISMNFAGGPGNFTRSLWSMLTGVERVEQGDVLRAGGAARRYSTVEEFESSTGIRIVVPTWLPHDLEITYIHYSDEGGLVDVFYPDGVRLSIELNSAIPDIIYEPVIVHEHNNIIFYVDNDTNIILWEYDGHFYQLGFPFDIYEYIEPIIISVK